MMDLNMINNNMNFMMNNMNNMMIHNQNNNNQNNNELILNLINQNIQFQNQIQANNNMIKSILENSNNNNLENINKTNTIYDEMYDIDFFPGKEGKKINVIFEKGYTKINVITPSDATMKELLNAFYIKFQIYGKAKNIKVNKLNDYYNLYRGSTISGLEKTIFECGLINNVEHIIFNDKNDLIGG